MFVLSYCSKCTFLAAVWTQASTIPGRPKNHALKPQVFKALFVLKHEKYTNKTQTKHKQIKKHIKTKQPYLKQQPYLKKQPYLDKISLNNYLRLKSPSITF